MSLAAVTASFATQVRQRVTIRNLRLGSGLVLFAYVATHLANHALGNLSLPAMNAGLDWVKLVWRNAPAGLVLYGSLAVHVALALWSIYARPPFQWRPAEIAQLALGLVLPALLTGHVVSTRLAYTLDGSSGDYAPRLYLFWVASPDAGSLQALALILAWAHGCLGLYFWLRLKPGFPRFAPLLLAVAVLVPVLALLGFVQGGRTVAALATDESWRIENLPLGPRESPEAAAKIAHLALWRDTMLAGFAASVLLALGARLLRRGLQRRRGLIQLTYSDGMVARVPRGTSVLEASRMLRIPHASVCNGRGRCSTCRIRVAVGDPGRMPPAAPAEAALLQRIGAGPEVRLACQLRPQVDMQVTPLVAPWGGLTEARRAASGFGEERFVVAMFVDMRGSTRFAETHLPFDTVFVINRFLDAVSRAVLTAGGAPNQFLGDGLLALFGLQSNPNDAARQAMTAVAGIGREVAALNELMAGNLSEPIRFGIGVHAGTAILGEIGGRVNGSPVFTAIGDPVNVAARLQSATKWLGVEAVISEAVLEAAGRSDLDAEIQEVAIEGRTSSVRACLAVRAADVLRSGEVEPTPA